MANSGEKGDGSDGLDRRCVRKKAPQRLNERLRTNAEMGNRVTRGHDHYKLFVPQVNTEWYVLATDN